MTNNPTIDGVSRVLIENAANYMEGSASAQVNIWCRELRALLDREVITDDHLRQRIAFLTSEIHAQSDVRAALQSTIAQLQARVEYLELELSAAENAKLQLAEKLGCADEPRWKWMLIAADTLNARIGELESGIGEKNQCDGCRSGIPLVNGSHRMGREGGYPDFMRCAAKLYADPPAPVAVAPDGWKLVPVEATRQMLRAFIAGGCSRSSYRDMINAAPACLDATAVNTLKPTEWHDLAADDEGLVS